MQDKDQYIRQLEEQIRTLQKQQTAKPRRLYSPREIAARRYRRIEWQGLWLQAFGQPEFSATWFISGASASGKSSFVMQLARELTHHAPVLYLSYEEGISLPFMERLTRFDMQHHQGNFRIATEDTIQDLRARLARRKSPQFIIIDSFQHAAWEWADTKQLLHDFPQKSFIFISQEVKSQPLGKAAVRLKYAADVKVKVVAFKAYCQGRFSADPTAYYPVWPEIITRTTNQPQ